MTIQLRLHPNQIKDLAVLRDFGPDRLSDLADALGNVEEPPLLPDALFNCVSSVLASESDIAERLVRQLVSLAGLGRQGGHSTEDVVAGVTSALRVDSEWDGRDLDKWLSVAEILKQLLLTPAVRLTAMTIELSYDYASLLRRARILTDVRPLFSEDATRVEAAVVSQTLRLRYDGIDGEHDLSIAMDEADIRELQQQCERALVKADAARHQFAVPGKLPVTITGRKADAVTIEE